MVRKLLIIAVFLLGLGCGKSPMAPETHLPGARWDHVYNKNGDLIAYYKADSDGRKMLCKYVAPGKYVWTCFEEGGCVGIRDPQRWDCEYCE